ncbi:hypothetical protein GF389_03495 [Candidatus Dojkabacteria bacterium]|nr:hypothetical protein [Candidatus Dojkabacteria bacterium]
MKKIFILISVFFAIISNASAQFDTGADPARLRDVEPIVVQLIYVIWGVGTLALTVLLMKIGFEYMTSFGDAQKQQEVREKGSKWLISLLVFFLAYPIILTFYNIAGIGGSDSNCYQDINTPGFRFFFPTVCTDPQASSDKYGIGADCSNFTPQELGLINGSRCCLSGGVIVPTDTFIGSKSGSSGISRIFKYSNSSGNCSSVDSCTTFGSDICDELPPKYIYDNASEELIISED